MAKRNLKEEINLLKQRGEFEHGLFNYRLKDLKSGLTYLKSIDNEADEFYKYLPIACVASIESFYRSAIQHLVDKGGKYFDNLSGLIDQIPVKLDFEIISNLQNKHFTLGEFISHLLPCNNVGNVNSNLSKILGTDFLEELKKHEPLFPGGGGIDNDLYSAFDQKYDSIIQSINRIFELRHIFSHESATTVNVDRNKIEEDLCNCEIFLDMASAFLYSTLYKNWGMSYHDQLELLIKEFEAKQIKINERIIEFRKESLLDVNHKHEFKIEFDKTIKYWKKFSEAKAKLKGIYPVTYLWSSFAFYQDYINSIDKFSKDLEK